MTDSRPAITGVHHFSPTVCNVEASVDWYEKVFGLERVPVTFPHYEREETGYAVPLVDPKSGLAIALHENRGNQGERFDECRTGLDHIGFNVTDRAEMDRWAEHLTAVGVEHSGIRDIQEPMAFSTLVFRDPDNIQLELITMG
ncbi:MAG TPA: VOC family protein [Acidimicrobiales bacterium]|nr:VOC family protein [Acidimicrobiales bacterium]